MSIHDSLNMFKRQNDLPTTETFDLDSDGAVIEKSLFKGLFLSIAIILLGTLSFGLGRLSSGESRSGVTITETALLENNNSPYENQGANVINALPNASSIVASKKGTKYHYSHCPGAKQISVSNRIIFETETEAQAAGYSLASNCAKR